MTVVFCHNASDRKAETWRQQLLPFEHLEFALSDAAHGIAAAVEQVAEQRRETDPSAPALEHGLDLFHTTYEAERVLAQEWRRVESLWEVGEACDAKLEHAKSQGIDARGPSQTARAAWSKAIGAFERVAALEAAGLGTLCGPEWKKVRNFLLDRRSLAFLDRTHQRLVEAEPRTEWRDVLVWRWWRLRHPASAANPLAAQVFAVALQRPLKDAEQVAYDRIAAILVSTFRASSAVECMNSVLRMQQSRHRRMTQPMLDLKRLYWNCRPFRSGPRKKTSPYKALGLELPTFNFWDLLQSDPRELTQQLSISGNKT